MASNTEQVTAIDWDSLEEIREALNDLRGMAYAVMVAGDENDVYTDATAAVYRQANRARDLFMAAAYHDEGAANADC